LGVKTKTRPETLNSTAYTASSTIQLQEAQLPLREQGVSLVRSSHHNATLWHLFFWV